MRRSGTWLLVTMLTISITAVAAFAINVHLKGGANAEPDFTDNVLTLEASGELAGLGTGDVFITLSATADTTATCTNPAGQTQPPGHNPAPTTVSGGVSIPENEIEHGNLAFEVETDPPATPIAGAPECPNPQWREDITNLAFKTATITVVQGGNLVLTVHCTFSSPTADGPVPRGNVSCTSN
jgi:hypothetical protein